MWPSVQKLGTVVFILYPGSLKNKLIEGVANFTVQFIEYQPDTLLGTTDDNRL